MPVERAQIAHTKESAAADSLLFIANRFYLRLFDGKAIKFCKYYKYYLALVLMQEAQTVAFLPAITLLCRLIFCVRLVLTLEWLTLLALLTPRPQREQDLGI